MNKDQQIDRTAFKKIAVILTPAVLLVFLGLWASLYGMGIGAARQFTSCFQSGTQVFFDENYFPDDLYAAKVTAYVSGRKILFDRLDYVRGSTLPDTNETNRYPVVAAAAIAFKRGVHYGSYTNDTYQSKDTPALILNPGAGGFSSRQGLPVRTIDENISPYAGDNYRLRQASQVHVHTGQSATVRGSTACFTINPDQAQTFFDSEIGNAGTIHIHR